MTEERAEHRDHLLSIAQRTDANRDPQVRSAWLLARAHGHWWAAIASYSSCPATWQDAEDNVAQDRVQNPTSMAGLACPIRDAEGSVHHVTMTGRTSWKIDTEGEVFLRVTRPGGIVAATATVHPCGSYTTTHEDAAEERHIWALAECLWALGVHYTP
jgi:hypothetical protein